MLDIVAWTGRIMGLVIVAISIALGINFASAVGDGTKGWGFLLIVAEPMGVGFLIMVAAEIVSRLGEGDDEVVEVGEPPEQC